VGDTAAWSHTVTTCVAGAVWPESTHLKPSRCLRRSSLAHTPHEPLVRDAA